MSDWLSRLGTVQIASTVEGAAPVNSRQRRRRGLVQESREGVGKSGSRGRAGHRTSLGVSGG